MRLSQSGLSLSQARLRLSQAGLNLSQAGLRLSQDTMSHLLNLPVSISSEYVQHQDFYIEDRIMEYLGYSDDHYGHSNV